MIELPTTVSPLVQYGILKRDDAVELPNGETVPVRFNPNLRWGTSLSQLVDQDYVNVLGVLAALGMPKGIREAIERVRAQLPANTTTSKANRNEEGYAQIQVFFGKRCTCAVSAAYVDKDTIRVTDVVPFCAHNIEVGGQEFSTARDAFPHGRYEDDIHWMCIDGVRVYLEDIIYNMAEIAPGWDPRTKQNEEETMLKLPDDISPLQRYGITRTQDGVKDPHGNKFPADFSASRHWASHNRNYDVAGYVHVRDVLDAMGMPKDFKAALDEIQMRTDLTARLALAKNAYPRGYTYLQEGHDWKSTELFVYVGLRNTYSLGAVYTTNEMGPTVHYVPFCPSIITRGGVQFSTITDALRDKMNASDGDDTITIDGAALPLLHIKLNATELAPGWESVKGEPDVKPDKVLEDNSEKVSSKHATRTDAQVNEYVDQAIEAAFMLATQVPNAKNLSAEDVVPIVKRILEG